MAESRPKRWSKAASKAQEAVDNLREALDNLKEVQDEYQEWLDNLPENLQSGSLADKLNEVTGFDVEGAQSSLDEIENTVQECDSADLPMGFGRD